MSMQDLISDYVARINNSINAQKSTAIVKKSNFIVNLTKTLVKKGIFDSFKEEEYYLKINFKNNLPFKPYLKRISKAGQRFYSSKNDFPKIQNGFGYNIITTSKGVKTHLECLRDGVGGEVVMQVIKQIQV